MIKCKRYPNVRELMIHYANGLGEQEILNIIDDRVTNKEEANKFSLFIWRMVEQMSEDSDSEVEVPGSTDYSDMLADVHYEINLYMAEAGYADVWEKVSEDA